MLPPPPPRLSTTTVCPRLSVSLSATPRATVSIPPPAASGTIRRTGRAGYCCACAVTASAASSTPQISRVFIDARRLLCHKAGEFGCVLELLQPEHRVAQLGDLGPGQGLGRELFVLLDDLAIRRELLLAPARGLHRPRHHRAVIEVCLDV